MTFIPFMLCDRLTDVNLLEDRRYVAEPKVDGQRAQLHIAGRRAVACYSRRKGDLLRHRGMAWLKDIEWPVDTAVVDGELCAGDGHRGLRSGFPSRAAVEADVGLAAFDLLALDGRDLMPEPWTDRRKHLDELLEGRALPRVNAVSVSHDAQHLYESWIGWGGEGIVLKDPASPYRPGVRSPAWLKVKPKLHLEAVVTGGSAERVPWGDGGAAVNLELTYANARTGAENQIRQAIRIPRERPFDLRIGQPAEIVCWGVMPSGALRHPMFVGWAGDPAAAA